ncbi:MAG TPA: hypothetical protein VII51_00980 [Gaiellaceae bacterium]
MTLLTPLGALLALAALLPLTAALTSGRRVAAVRRTLGLSRPARRPGIARLAAATAGIALLGLAAAQPVLTRQSRERVRSDVQALFVFDTSRSMAASTTATSPTRLDRAIAAAVRLRTAIPDVEAGVATLTDRVLPDLFPVADVGGFDGVARRTVAIESPPPRDENVRATTYTPLADIPSDNYFGQAAKERIVVLLTDGESNPVDPGEIARALSAKRGYRLMTLRFWQSRESVYSSNGKPEAGYRPDPSGRTILDGLAAATGGRAFEEGNVGAASSYLQRLVGHGPAVVARGTTTSRLPLAPYAAALALLLVLATLLPLQSGRRVGVRSPA